MQTTIEIRTKDGSKIFGTVFNPKKKNGYTIVVGSAIGVSKEFYFFFASFFKKLGYTVITFDYRGIGQSAPLHLKGFEANMHQWATQDLDAVLLYARNNYPDKEIIYVGHCISGEIIGLAQASQYISKMILVSSSLSHKRLRPLKDRIRMSIIKLFIPVLNKLLGYYPARLFKKFTDIPKGVMYQWSEWSSSTNGLFDTFPESNYQKLEIPILVYTFKDDWYCRPDAVKELLDRFDKADLSWHHINPKTLGIKKVGHIGFFHLSMRRTLWTELSEWLIEKEHHYGLVNENS